MLNNSEKFTNSRLRSGKDFGETNTVNRTHSQDHTDLLNRTLHDIIFDDDCMLGAKLELPASVSNLIII